VRKRSYRKSEGNVKQQKKMAREITWKSEEEIENA